MSLILKKLKIISIRKMINKKDNMIIYQADTRALELKVDSQSETVWASQKDIANIFDIDRTLFNRYINNIFKHGSLDNKTHLKQ
jgi:hypothetical protein